MKGPYLTLISLIVCILLFGEGHTTETSPLRSLEECHDKLAIRISENRLKVDIAIDEGVNASLILSVNGQEQINTLSSEKSAELLDSLLSKGILALPDDDYSGIDGLTTYIETVVEGEYKKVSYWSARSGAIGTSNDKNREAAKDIVLFVQDFLNYKDHWDALYETLAPGIYYGFNIDRFLPSGAEKSNLYHKIENHLSTDFGLSENSKPRDFPLIVMGQHYYSLEDINKYSMSDIEAIKIIKPEDPECVLFGQLGTKNGVVLIELKNK